LKPFWHPLSTLFLADPWCLATTEPLRLLLRAGGVRLRYAGDRMWPALRHGATLELQRVAPAALRPGDVVVAPVERVPDLLRVEGLEEGHVRLRADADPDFAARVPTTDVLARAPLPARRVSPLFRWRRRVALDLIEAWRERVDAGGGDAAGSVLEKYDYQAPFYARASGPDMEPALLESVRRVVPPGGDVLVVGSGSGRESFALAESGFAVLGVDFSPAMVALAAAEAARRGLDVEFRTADVRALDLEPRYLAAVLFTYDVYSFLPAVDRGDTLARLAGFVAPDGVVLLSARRIGSAWERAVLGLQWLAGRRRGGGRWGESHTRWIAADGRLRRSFVQ